MGIKQPIETAFEWAQMVDLAVTKIAVINMCEEVRETMLSELKENVMVMSYQMEDINEEIEIMKKNQMEILEVKSIIEMKNSPKGFSRRREPAEESANLMTDQ